jgi:hypothetical protein
MEQGQSGDFCLDGEISHGQATEVSPPNALTVGLIIVVGVADEEIRSSYRRHHFGRHLT